MIRSEVILPRRAVRQPRPSFVPGGDCAACCLAGVLGLPVRVVYERIYEKAEPPSYHEVTQILYRAERAGLVERFVDDVPMWPFQLYSGQATWGAPAWAQNLSWWRYLRLALDGGYYGLAEVTYDRKGPFQAPDHYVVLCGVRELWPEPGTGGGPIHAQVLVSCSASCPEGEWVEVLDLLKHRGGFSMQLARPAIS